MNRFLKFTISFLIAFILIDRIGGWILDGIFLRPGNHEKINEYLDREPVPHIVIMGSSRAARGVVPQRLGPSVYNLGHDGTYMPFQTGLLRLMEQRRRLPAIVVLEIDPYEFMASGPTHDVLNLRPYYYDSDSLRVYINSLSSFERLKYLSSLYRYNGKLFSILHEYLDSGLNPAAGGYEMIEASTTDSINTARSAQVEPELSVSTLNESRLRYLKSFIRICRRNNVRLICYTAPFFRVMNYFARGANAMHDMLLREDIPYIDYSTKPIPIVQSNAGYWKDTRHVNDKGARIVTDSLANQIRKLVDSPRR